MLTNIDGRHKMISSAGNRDISINQDGKAKDDNIGKASSSSGPKLGLKDPRIVHVSRSFGGKDRHSKVYTMKGMRDRRVRLSVPTAIQLYALQDRLGLNQPSKVVDWLLNAAKHEIDELPPLQALPGSSGQDHQRRIESHEQEVPQSSLSPIEDASIMNLRDYVACSSLPSTSGPRISNNVVGENQMPKLTFWNTDAVLRAKCKEVAGETILEKNNWIKRNEQEKQEGIGGLSPQVLSHVSLQRANQPSLAGFLNNVVPYNSYHQCEPSNLSLFPSGSHLYSSQTEEPYNFNSVSLPSSLSLPPQLLAHPSRTTPLFFPPYVSPPLVSDPRQADHFQMLSSNQNSLSPNSLTPSLFSIAQPRRPFQLNMNSMIVRPQNDTGSRSGADNSVRLSTLSTTFFQNDPKSTHG